jgi:hypothetical protein
MRLCVFAHNPGDSNDNRMQALTQIPYATLATAAANSAMWHASKRLERE